MKRISIALVAVLLASVLAAGVTPTAASAACDYSAAGQNGGWGWDAETSESCPPRTSSSSSSNSLSAIVSAAIGLVVPSFTVTAPVQSAATDVPQNVRATTVRGGIGLSWSPVPGAIGYNVYRNNQYVETVNKGTWFRDNATPGTTNDYYVVSFTSGGASYSARSEEVTGRALQSAVISIGDSFISCLLYTSPSPRDRG